MLRKACQLVVETAFGRFNSTKIRMTRQNTIRSELILKRPQTFGYQSVIIAVKIIML
jgi:hypothetical protein